MDGSYIVLDTTEDSTPSVICLDSSIENSPVPRVTRSLARDLGKELTKWDINANSLIVISDTSEDDSLPNYREIKENTGDAPNTSKSDQISETVLTSSNSKESNKEVENVPAFHDSKKSSVRGQKRKREDTRSVSGNLDDTENGPFAKRERLGSVTAGKENCPGEEENDIQKYEEKKVEEPAGKKRRRSERLAAVSTPSEPHRKISKVLAAIQTSTPVAGTEDKPSPDLPPVTPITVKYERMRSELSATKKQQEKLISIQEELQKELENVRSHFAEKKKEDCKLIEVKSDEDSVLRPIVIDASNVAMSHGNNKVFSCKGIALCIRHFQQRGHKNITAFLPLSRKTAEANRKCKMTDAHILDDLESRGLLVFTPSRRLNGHRVTPYDDRFILDLACRNGGVIISNDNYRDLMQESHIFRQVVEKRLIMYTFAGDNFMVPDDPHGRYGPHLNDILRKDSEWSRSISPLFKTKTTNQSSLFQYNSGPIPQLRRSPRIARILHNRQQNGSSSSSAAVRQHDSGPIPHPRRSPRNDRIPNRQQNDTSSSSAALRQHNSGPVPQPRRSPRNSRILHNQQQNGTSSSSASLRQHNSGPIPQPRRSPRIARILHNRQQNGTSLPQYPQNEPGIAQQVFANIFRQIGQNVTNAAQSREYASSRNFEGAPNRPDYQYHYSYYGQQFRSRFQQLYCNY